MTLWWQMAADGDRRFKVDGDSLAAGGESGDHGIGTIFILMSAPSQLTLYGAFGIFYGINDPNR